MSSLNPATRSWCAEPRPGRVPLLPAFRRNERRGALVLFTVLLAVVAARTNVHAAGETSLSGGGVPYPDIPASEKNIPEYKSFHYETGIREIYSQDVLRIGQDQFDDYITSLYLAADLDFRTARSQTTFSYSPEYLKYASLTELDSLDHHYRGLYKVEPGRRSEFDFRQGYSLTSRQVGFTDLAGSGGSVAEPIATRARRTSWDFEPQWIFKPGAAQTFSIEALYRSESYNQPSLPDGVPPIEFVDYEQLGAQGDWDHDLSPGHRIGLRVRGDHYHFYDDLGTITGAYEDFGTGAVTWTAGRVDRFQFEGSAGAYRGTGPFVVAVTEPTADLYGNWRWSRTSFRTGYSLGYASGGGLSTAQRNQQFLASFGAWNPVGLELHVDVATIRRESFGDTALVGTVASPALDGQQVAVGLSRRWRSGIALSGNVGYLRQGQQDGTTLGYFDGSAALIFRPPERQTRPAPPPPPQGEPPPEEPPSGL
jgi:hypothetical protein